MATCPICLQENRRQRYVVKGYPILECLSCGGFYLGESLKPTRDNAADYEEDYYSRGVGSTKLTGYFDYEAELKLHVRNFEQYIRLIRRHSKGTSLLDVGCASGHFLIAASRAGFEAKGLDVSEAATQRVRELGFEAWTGSPDAVEIEERFDVVTLWETIEHLPNPDAVLRRIRSWLKPDGILVVATGDNTSLLSRILGKRWWYLVPPDHVVYYNPRALTIVLERNGYQVATSNHILGHWVSLRNLSMKLMRSFQVDATTVLKIVNALPDFALKVLHGTTNIVVARPRS